MATTTDNDYAKAVLARLEEFLHTQQYTNVTLKAGDVQIQCHRVLLAASSEYFHTMFQSGMKESRSDVIDIIGSNADTLTLLVKYLYSSNIDITVDNVQNILEACHQFRLISLLKLCEEFMVQHVNPNNCVEFYTFAERYNLNSLKKTAQSSMVTNLPEVIRTKEFCNLTIDGIVDCISDPALKSPPVDSVFEAACTWIRFDPDRESLFHRLVEHLPLHLCTRSYLTRTVATYAPMRQDDCHRYLEEAFQHLMDPEQHTQVSMDTSPHGCPLIIGGRYGDFTYSSDIQYLMVQGTVPSWHLLTKLPVKVRQFSAVVMDGGILVTGGWLYESEQASADCWMFDLTTKKWNKMPPLHGARYLHGSILHGGCVYLGGGYTGVNTVLSTFEVYNQETRQWSKAPDMPQAVGFVQMVSCARYIYVVGCDTKSLFLYDPVTRTWVTRRDQPHNTNGGCAVTLNGRLYVVGGSKPTCVRYEVDSDTWTVLTPPTGTHVYGAATVCQGKIMVAGGYSTSVEEYTPEVDTWSKSAAQLQKVLSQYCMVTIDSSFCQ